MTTFLPVVVVKYFYLLGKVFVLYISDEYFTNEMQLISATVECIYLLVTYTYIVSVTAEKFNKL